MPLAQLYIGTGHSNEKKARLIASVTKALEEALGPLRQPVWVIINEVPFTNLGVDGIPMGSPSDSDP